MNCFMNNTTTGNEFLDLKKKTTNYNCNDNAYKKTPLYLTQPLKYIKPSLNNYYTER